MQSSQKPINRQSYENSYRNARSNLLIVVAFTVINIILLIAKSDTYFLFSAFVPYLIVSVGMMLCGMYPEEFDINEFSLDVPFGTEMLAVFIAAALVIVVLYFLSWLLSKNQKVGWLIFALVFFSIDTLLMLVLSGIQLDNIIDIVFHAWVIVSLSIGINAASKLKKLPPEEIGIPGSEDGAEMVESSNANSTAVRYADPDVKARILLETEAEGHSIVYRRVKRVNELVIDGSVYDEYEALIEKPHTLSAEINGRLIQAGYDGFHSFIAVNGETVAKKLRLA